MNLITNDVIPKDWNKFPSSIWPATYAHTSALDQEFNKHILIVRPSVENLIDHRGHPHSSASPQLIWKFFSCSVARCQLQFSNYSGKMFYCNRARRSRPFQPFRPRTDQSFAQNVWRYLDYAVHRYPVLNRVDFPPSVPHLYYAHDWMRRNQWILNPSHPHPSAPASSHSNVLRCNIGNSRLPRGTLSRPYGFRRMSPGSCVDSAFVCTNLRCAPSAQLDQPTTNTSGSARTSGRSGRHVTFAPEVDQPVNEEQDDNAWPGYYISQRQHVLGLFYLSTLSLAIHCIYYSIFKYQDIVFESLQHQKGFATAHLNLMFATNTRAELHILIVIRKMVWLFLKLSKVYYNSMISILCIV